MREEYVVITETGDASYNDEESTPERFRSFKAAKKRAEAIAERTPGETIKIYKLTAEAIAQVQKVVTSGVDARAHYKQ